jgi:RNAse (barnase) inhibitor barstar
MAYQIIGKLHSIGEREQKTEKFFVREFVIYVEKITKKRDDSYYVKLQVINNNCEVLDGRNIQDAMKFKMDVKVDFEIDGYKSKNDGRVWNNLRALTIIPLGVQTTIDSPQEETYPTHQKPAYIAPDAPHVEDDLPF